jgi:hypothetical protein
MQLKDFHRNNQPYSHAMVAAPRGLDPHFTPGEQPLKEPWLDTMMHGVKTDNSIKFVQTEDERVRAARKVAKREDGHV